MYINEQIPKKTKSFLLEEIDSRYQLPREIKMNPEIHIHLTTPFLLSSTKKSEIFDEDYFKIGQLNDALSL